MTILSFDLQVWPWPSTYPNVSNGTTTPHGEQLCQIILKSMHKCRIYDGLDKLIYVTFKCDLTFNLNGTFPPQGQQLCQIIFKSTHKRSSWHRQIRTHAYTQAHTPYKTCNSYVLLYCKGAWACSHFQNSLMSIIVVEKYWLKAQISAVESLSQSDLVLSEVTWGGINKYNNVLCSFKGNGWVNYLRFYFLFNSIPVISGWWVDDNERLCEMEPRLWMRRFRFEQGSNLER